MQKPDTDKLFLKLATTTLIFLYLVIIAGSVVRATGSGMGCPDWPKCFGYYIPPTDPSQVEFHAEVPYKKGMMIIADDTLWRARKDFASGKKFDSSNWEKFPDYNSTKFFVVQTWTEYINRLLGAFSGLFTFLLFIVSVFRWRKDKLSIFLLLIGIMVLAFIGWMGKVVVNSNLTPLMITFHMLSALVMIALVIAARARVCMHTRQLQKISLGKAEKILLVFVLLATLDQVIFGTQVRQQIDVINGNMSGLSRETWITQLNGIYTYHKIMAVVVAITNIILFIMLWKKKPGLQNKLLISSLLLIVLAEYGAGVVMHNFSIPAFVQPVHLVLAMLLFGIQFALFMRSWKNSKI
ncbi:MAG: COX15/CtaA family protein [Bacteroidetes bacterium]|nr:COX15/CtaA family protein [Bacteroidota bacterium]